MFILDFFPKFFLKSSWNQNIFIYNFSKQKKISCYGSDAKEEMLTFPSNQFFPFNVG